jgi:large subunit ribosomal protein L30
MAKSKKKLQITLVKSPIGCVQRQKDTIKALGLCRMHHTVMQEDNPVIRGMVGRVAHLVKVEELKS